MNTTNDRVRSMKDQAEGFAKLAKEFGRSMGKAGKRSAIPMPSSVLRLPVPSSRSLLRKMGSTENRTSLRRAPRRVWGVLEPDTCRQGRCPRQLGQDFGWGSAWSMRRRIQEALLQELPVPQRIGSGHAGRTGRTGCQQHSGTGSKR